MQIENINWNENYLVKKFFPMNDCSCLLSHKHCDNPFICGVLLVISCLMQTICQSAQIQLLSFSNPKTKKTSGSGVEIRGGILVTPRHQCWWWFRIIMWRVKRLSTPCSILISKLPRGEVKTRLQWIRMLCICMNHLGIG